MNLLTKMKVQLTGSDGMPASGTSSIVQLPIHLVIPNPNQPRKFFSHDSIRELSDSIRRYGVLQPVTVRRKNDGTYELVAGERRLRAAALAGNLKIPAIIMDMSDDDSAIVALMENIQRENLTFMEEAVAYRQLLEMCFITQDELAKRLGKSQGAIANKIRLLKLPQSVREIVRDFNLTERHARALLRLSSESEQVYAARRIADLNLGVKQADELVDRIIKKGIDEKPTEKVIKSITDVRVFFKTITKAISLMNDKGIEASAKKDETDNYYEYLIRIGK